MKTMRKYLIPVIILLAVLSLVTFKNYNSVSPSKVQENQQIDTEAKVNLVIDFGNTEVKSFETTVNNDSTAFSALKDVAEKEDIVLETIEYDFGVFVKKVGTFESSAEKSWIYYVNGASGQIAADQQKIKSGDKVEWKYEVPKI